VMFCDVNSGELVKKYSSTQKINDISISPDSTTMTLALNNATIEIRDYNDGQIKKTFQDWKIIDPYRFSKFLPSNSLFATGSENGVIRIWNISGNIIWIPQKDNKINSSLKALSVSDDGVKIVTLSSDNLITVWDLPQQNMQVSKNLANVPIPNTTVEKSAELVYSLPLIPVIAGAEIPKARANLEKANIKDISELARWGSPQINAVSFIDNSRMILAATSAGVYFYNSTDLSLKYFFETKGWLSSFCVSEDGTWVVTGDKNGNVAVWNIVDGKEIARFEGQSGEIISLAISPDKSLVASVTDNKIVSLWDLNQKQLKFSFKKHALRVNKVLFSPDGQYAISGGDDFQVMFWDVNSGEFVKQYPSTQKINDISISPDGTMLALALNNATIEIRNYKDGQIRKTFEDWRIVDPFKLIKFLPSNSLLVSGSENGIVRVWNINGTSIWETPSQDKDGKPIEIKSLRSISISDDGVKFVTLSDDNLINVWDIDLKSLLVSKKLDYGLVQRMSISPDNKTLAYQVGDSTVALWSIENHNQIARLDGSLPRGFPFSSNNEFLVTQVNDTLSLYLLKSTQPALLYTLYGFSSGGTVNYLMDDKIVAASTTGFLNYWSVSSGKELTPSFLVKYEGGCRVFYRDNGQFLVAGSINGILNLETNIKYFCHIPRGPRTLSEDFLNDGSITALSLENQALEVWDAQTGDQKKSIKSQAKGNMFDVAISNDGKLLAAASASGVIEIYDLTTDELIKSFNAHTAAVTQVLFTSDLKYIISASDDGTVRFWGINN
jgi:WD40 repeat protein